MTTKTRLRARPHFGVQALRTQRLGALCAFVVFFPFPSALLQSQAHTPRIAVLSEKGFPALDGITVSEKEIQQALKGYQVRLLSSQALSSELSAGKFDLLITPYGSAFPKEIANTLFSYLRTGGNWINLGGVPLSVPFVNEKKSWMREVQQTAFHKTLGITQAFQVSPPKVDDSLRDRRSTRRADAPSAQNFRIQAYSANEEIDGSQDLLKEFSAEDVFEQYVRFTSTKDFPSEDGTAGQRDAVLRPLIWGISKEGMKVAAPFVAIDRLQGEFAGGRWVLANYKGAITQKGIRWLVDYALQGSAQLKVTPAFASYYQTEIPSCTISFSRFGRQSATHVGECQVVLLDPEGKELSRTTHRLRGDSLLSTVIATLPLQNPAPGLYSVRVRQVLKSAATAKEFAITATNGFWIHDAKLLAGGSPFSTDGTYLLRDGRPYPVTGTTYMASDVARKFLLEPNPVTWDKDFALMTQHGINMVRTGLWTAWKNLMLDVGSFNEQALRSLDAFVLTARKYDIPLIFTFFAFIPETWGGENAYLDPRSVHAQKTFLATVAQRYPRVNDLIWDLINEPSFCNPKALWSCRPNYDRFEVAAWNEWLGSRAPLSSYQLKWRMTAEETVSLPKFEEFADLNIFDERRPLKAVDYRLFAQDMFRRWIGEMTAALRSNGNTQQLITVGQDEGGTNDSPNNQFMGDALGFTSMHNWWLNDDLVWDNIITKKPGIPNLLEETGIMFYEKMDGSAWRTEEEAAALLERKLAISLGAGGAGFIEWIWNINPFMKSDNEATIGLHRTDGTAKPELMPISEYSRFFDSNKERMKGRQREEVVLVIPHSNMFSTRNFATEATKRAIRVLSYRLGIPVSAVSEYGIRELLPAPKLIILPSPRTFSEAAWQEISALVKGGSTLLLSGPIDSDEHLLPVERLRTLGIEASPKPIAQEEPLIIDGKESSLSYRNLKFQRLEKNVAGPKPEVLSRIHGKGSILWSPLPVENADNIEPTVAWYEFGLRKAGVQPAVSVDPHPPGLLVLPTVFEGSLMITCVSESDHDINTMLKLRESGASIMLTVPAQRTVILFADRKTGAIESRLH